MNILLNAMGYARTGAKEIYVKEIRIINISIIFHYVKFEMENIWKNDVFEIRNFIMLYFGPINWD